MVFYFKARPEAGDFTIFMGLDKYENEELIKYGFPEDIWYTFFTFLIYGFILFLYFLGSLLILWCIIGGFVLKLIIGFDFSKFFFFGFVEIEYFVLI